MAGYNVPAGIPTTRLADLGGTPYRSFYTDSDGAVVELALGANGEVLTSNGPSAAPGWSVPVSGGGAVSSLTGTPNTVPFADDVGDVQELALGAAGQVLQSNGLLVAPSFADLPPIPSALPDLEGTADTVPYTDGLGAVQEVGLGASGTLLQSNGPGAAPSWVAPASGSSGASIGLVLALGG